MSPELKEKILEYARSGLYLQRDLAYEFNLSPATISRICKGIEIKKRNTVSPIYTPDNKPTFKSLDIPEPVDNAALRW